MSRVFAFLGPGRAMRRQSPVLSSLCHVFFFFFFLQESIPAPFTRGVSLFLQHPDLSQRFSQQSGRLLSSTQDPALGCPVYGLGCLLPRIRVCRYVPSLPFRCLPYGRRSQLCAFFSILRHYMELFLAVLVVKE